MQFRARTKIPPMGSVRKIGSGANGAPNMLEPLREGYPGFKAVMISVSVSVSYPTIKKD